MRDSPELLRKDIDHLSEFFGGRIRELERRQWIDRSMVHLMAIVAFASLAYAILK